MFVAAEAFGQLVELVNRLREQQGLPTITLHKQFSHHFFGLTQPDVVAMRAIDVAAVRAVRRVVAARI